MLSKALLRTLFLIATCIFLAAHSSTAQIDSVKSVFGKGIRVAAKDSSFFAKLSFRMQLNYTAEFTDVENGTLDNDLVDRARIRRSRLKADGFVFDPKLKFKFEYDMVRAIILDAVIKWKFAKNTELWFGQTKLPGNRQRLFSSQKLQLVDRAIVNGVYTLDRDKGFQLRYGGKVGGMVLRQSLAITQGEGIFFSGKSPGGHGFTAKLEVLPFGSFSKKGDYFGADLVREDKPKLALAFTFDHNASAFLDRGRLGSDVGFKRDLQTLFGDLYFKYKGTSLLVEVAQRISTSGDPVLLDTAGAVVSSFQTGTGAMVQLGYNFKNMFEVAGRYDLVQPEKITGRMDEARYTFGISKYLVGHSLKVQSDVTLIEVTGAPQELMFRLQTELSF